MNLESLRAVVTSKAARQLLVAQKHSPKILFTAGVVGVVATTVLACRATLKVSDVLDVHEKKDTDLVDSYNADITTEDECKKKQNQLKIKTGLEIARLYGPALGLGVLSVAALTGSHVVLSKRNTALMATYAAVDRAYKEYRQRIVDEYGTEVDKKIVNGMYAETVTEKTAEGTVKHGTRNVHRGMFGSSPYAVVFDEQSHLFSKEPGRNVYTIQMKQSQANDKFHARGHLFLNEVYDMLGLPRTKAGAVVGWVWRRDSEAKTGDNYVSFGVFDNPDTDMVEAFIDGNNYWPVLDFNVDGVILDLI